jgi:D-alanyl-D-alanine carboxypeptidase
MSRRHCSGSRPSTALAPEHFSILLQLARLLSCSDAVTLNFKSWWARIFSLALCFVSSSGAGPAPALPQSTPGRIAEKFLAAINGADPEATDQFVADYIADEPWNRMTREKYRSLLRKLREQSGDLRVERIMMADDRNLRVLIASAKAGKKVGLEIVLPKKESTRACLLWIHHFPAKPPSALPKTIMDEPAQVAAIERHLDECAEVGIHSGAVLIAKGDTMLLHKAWGLAHSIANTPNRTDMQYGTASVGKMFTAVAIAQLHQAHKIEYTDTIGQHLPDYPNKEAAQKVQVRHLLAHTGGLGDPFDSPKLANSKNYKRQADYFETFAEKSPAFEPGERHEYSNGGYIVLAAVVEKITGLPFAEYVRRNIFEPAGMPTTGLTTASKTLPVSVPHAVTVLDDPLGLKGPQPKSTDKEAQDGAGMGGWTSTTDDLFKFARALRTCKLLDATHTAEITSGKVAFVPPPMNVKYCYGFYEMPLGQDRMVGHSGGGGDSGVGAEVEMLWNSEHTIVVLSNHGLEEARRTAHDIARFLVFQEEHQSEGGLTSAK